MITAQIERVCLNDYETYASNNPFKYFMGGLVRNGSIPDDMSFSEVYNAVKICV